MFIKCNVTGNIDLTSLRLQTKVSFVRIAEPKKNTFGGKKLEFMIIVRT